MAIATASPTVPAVRWIDPQDLLEPRRITANGKWVVFQCHGQPGPAFLKHGRHRLDGRVDDLADVQILFSQFNASTSDSGNVQQIIEQPCHVSRLTLDDVVCLLNRLSIRLFRTHHFRCAEDRSQRIPQFMGKHRKELLAAASRSEDLLLRLFALRDVQKGDDHAHDPSVGPDGVIPGLGKETGPIGPPHRLFFDVFALSGSQHGSDRTFFPTLALDKTTMEDMDIFTDQIVDRRVSQHPRA
jgi:hypothetical protein